MEKRGTKVKCFRQGKEVILGCLISFYTRKMMCFLSGGKGILMIKKNIAFQLKPGISCETEWYFPPKN